MSARRVYLPATTTMLTALVADGELRPPSGTGFAVTAAVREEYTADDDDQLAEVAMGEAALASLRLLSADPEATPRRVVVSVDVEPVTERPDLDAAVVRVPVPVPGTAVAAVHIDLAEAEADVRRAAELIDAADLGDQDAELAVGDAEDHPLAWYAPQEVPFLLELL